MRYLLFLIFCLFSLSLLGQDEAVDTTEVECVDEEPEMFPTIVEGRVMTAMITETGDTLIMAELDDISITSLRTFKSDEDYKKYMKFKRYAAYVYPYAKQAIRIFREMEVATAELNNRKRKKHIKKLQDELRKEFETPLTKMTKLQGKIMMKMIEKELNTPMYDLIKNLRGGFSASYWNNIGKLYSYDIKEGYIYGKYEILDAVLNDFDISYKIEQDNLDNYK